MPCRWRHLGLALLQGWNVASVTDSDLHVDLRGLEVDENGSQSNVRTEGLCQGQPSYIADAAHRPAAFDAAAHNVPKACVSDTTSMGPLGRKEIVKWLLRSSVWSFLRRWPNVAG